MASSAKLEHTREWNDHAIRSEEVIDVLAFVAWIVLAIFALPLAILALLLYPILWLISLPFRLVGISVSAVFDLIGAILRLPARLLRGSII
jgi:hypothetical protein